MSWNVRFAFFSEHSVVYSRVFVRTYMYMRMDVDIVMDVDMDTGMCMCMHIQTAYAFTGAYMLHAGC